MTPIFASENSISLMNSFNFFISSTEITCGESMPIFLPSSATLFIAFNSALRISGCLIPYLMPCMPSIGLASFSFGEPSRSLNSSLLMSDVLTQISSKYSAICLMPLKTISSYSFMLPFFRK